jgi:hypothetical protein
MMPVNIQATFRNSVSTSSPIGVTRWRTKRGMAARRSTPNACAAGQRGQPGAEVDACVAAGDLVQHGAEFGEGAGAGGVGPAAHQHPGGRVMRARHQPRPQRGAQMRVGDDADHRGRAEARDAAGQVGVVGQHRADTDQHGVMLAAQGVRHAAGRLPGDPAAFPAMRGDPPVQRGRELEGHQRAALGHAQDEARGNFGRLVAQQPLLHRDAGIAQAIQAGAIHAGIGVAQGDNDAGDAGRDQRIGARRRAAPVAARLQRDIGRRPARRSTRHGQGGGFGMRAAAGSGEAAADHQAVTDDDAADRGVGPGVAKAAPGERQGGPHVGAVGGRVLRRVLHNKDYVVSPSDPRKSSKSLASRKLR